MMQLSTIYESSLTNQSGHLVCAIEGYFKSIALGLAPNTQQGLQDILRLLVSLLTTQRKKDCISLLDVSHFSTKDTMVQIRCNQESRERLARRLQYGLYRHVAECHSSADCKNSHIGGTHPEAASQVACSSRKRTSTSAYISSHWYWLYELDDLIACLLTKDLQQQSHQSRSRRLASLLLSILWRKWSNTLRCWSSKLS